MDRARDDFRKLLRKKVSGLKEVISPEQCQVILLFCPIITRAGTDIDAALTQLIPMKDSTPVIMVMLHQTFDPDKTLSDSNSAIKRENIFAVNCLFFDNGLLKCPKNEDAVEKTAKYLKSKNLTSYYCLNNCGNPNPSTDRNAENHPLISDGGSSQEDQCCSRCICC